jgi:leucyl-tRNA synthetase
MQELIRMAIPFTDIQKKWRKYWEDNKLYHLDLNQVHNKLYCLVMFPYPSSDKLHLGHWFNYAPVDTWARFQRMNGFDVFQPMGFDAFGLPAENYAVKSGVHPQITTRANVTFIRNQLKEIGAMYDWSYEVNTSDPEYYKWTQWLFLQFYKHGLAYRAEAAVNWCPSCQTVLANEQVIETRCERCSSLVEKKFLTQWFLRITSYADQLLEGLERINWPEKTKLMQKNWIGKSPGVEINFQVKSADQKKLTVFTTRPDTLFGATYLVLAPEHPLVEKITTVEQKQQVADYIKATSRVSEIDRTSTIREKTGVFTGAYAINPVNQQQIPVWIADYVLLTYGTGAIMAVPAHDERDFDFAGNYNLPIKKVILEEGHTAEETLTAAFTGEGTMINSAGYNGLHSTMGIQRISADLERDGVGQRTVKYKFRDWLISRQRYWGAPIPMIFCEKCGEVPVPENELPVVLPYEVDFKPRGVPPLATAEKFVKTTCPICSKPARREVETMDTFVDSSWYFLRYTSNELTVKPWDDQLVNKWLPIDQYVGGVDHATMHLLYARFFIKALKDMGLLKFDEPFSKLIHQGVIKGPDGQRMSKSRGNVINPEQYLDKYGSDIFRCYLMFGFDFQDGGPWDDSGIAALDKFINRLWRLVEDNRQILIHETNSDRFLEPEQELNTVMHNSIKGATADIERFHFNTALSRIMELVNGLYHYLQNVEAAGQNTALLKKAIKNLVLLLAPFAPHLSEELWEMCGEKPSIFNQAWPVFDPAALIKEEITWVIQINGKIRERISAAIDLSQEQAREIATTSGRMPELLAGKKIQKVIVVPKKLINLVVT